MTAKQLNKIIDKLVYCFADDNLTDEKVERAIRAIPYYFNDFIENLEKQDIYVERSKHYIAKTNKHINQIYFELDSNYNYEIDKENTDFKNGYFTLIKREKKNETN